jgi:hypothetical protein
VCLWYHAFDHVGAPKSPTTHSGSFKDSDSWGHSKCKVLRAGLKADAKNAEP